MDTVLLVDDDAAIRELYTIYLKQGGFAPLTVSGGSSCLDLLETTKPDLIILDLMMEPMDGWETLVAINGNPDTRTVPVVIITGKQPVPEEILVYGICIWDYRVKPVDIERVVSSLHLVIERDRELKRQVDAIKARGSDPAAADEYSRLLHLVTVAHLMEKRRRKFAWTDPVPVAGQEAKLMELHARLGFPDALLETGEIP